jgi:iron complex transport system ATP-binding protein
VEILRLVERLNREQGMTIIMVLHDINQALAYSDQVIGLRDGAVALQGAPDKVINSESIQTLYGIHLPVCRPDGRLCVMAI